MIAVALATLLLAALACALVAAHLIRADGFGLRPPPAASSHQERVRTWPR